MAVPQSFVVLDLETTDLPRPGVNVKITEIAVQSFSRASLFTSQPGEVLSPRVSNRMQFCINPGQKIHPIAAEITGLTDEALNTENKFDKGLCEILNHFLARLPKPICLVAHNGIKFDFPVLQSELNNIGETLDDELLALDSLNAFKDMLPRGTHANQLVPFAINEPLAKKLKTAAVLKSHKLDDLYKFLVTSKKRVDSHSALSDVTALTELSFPAPNLFSCGQMPKLSNLILSRKCGKSFFFA